MQKIFFFLVITVCLAFVVPAQTDFNRKELIPKDPSLTYGILPNGLTYYVKANKKPENRAELMMIVKAGSVLEDDDQQGLAHFCEHMAFNGTKNYPKHELIKYFESIGMEFGPEINAYTGFDETVYMLKIPLEEEIYIEKGLQVLYDWACQVTDSNEEIEKERGVIREEWRGGQNASKRMMREWLPVFLHESKYAERLPIGKMEVVDNCEPDVLRRYRKDWYRPDLQAVIVVGDFNQEAMTNKVKKLFSEIPAQKETRKVVHFDIPDHKETLVSVVTDKEAQYPVVQVYYKHPVDSLQTFGDYRRLLKQTLYNSMINARLQELTQKPEPPFVYAGSSYSKLFGPKSVYQSFVVAKNGKIPTALCSVLLENERVKKFGFTASELEREKSSLLKSYEVAYNERNNIKSINLANEYKDNFLEGEAIPGIEKEFELANKFVASITLDEVNVLAGKWITEENRVVIVTAPEIEGVPVPTGQEVLALLEEVEKEELVAYEDAAITTPLVEEIPEAGKVISKEPIETIDAELWTLSNGIKVYLKKTGFKDDEIQFKAFSEGGQSLYSQSDDVSAGLAEDILSSSGLAKFDRIVLDKYLADKMSNVTPYINELTEGLNGSSNVADLETMMQMIYLYFTQQRMDEDAYKSFMNRLSAQLENRKANPMAAYSDTIHVTFNNYHPRKRPLTNEILTEANFGRMKVITRERFANPGDFVFFFVGAIDFEILKPLVEKYIGSLAVDGTKEQWRDLGVLKPNGDIEKTVYAGREPKSFQVIRFHDNFKYNQRSQIELEMLSSILSTRLLEVVREDKSSVYSIGARPSAQKYPNAEYGITIQYGCAPGKVSELQQTVFDQINDLIENGPKEDELGTAREKVNRAREINLKENGWWLSYLANSYFLDEADFKTFNTFDKTVASVSLKSLKKAAKKYFNFENYISVALKPAADANK